MSASRRALVDRRRADGQARCARWRAASTCWSPRPAACSISCASNAVRLDSVEVLVLDEADRMLDMGFIHDIRTIVAQAAERAPDAVLLGHHAAARSPSSPTQMLRDPAAGRGDAGRPPRSSASTQRVIHGRPRGKAAAAGRSCCAAKPVDRALVFTRTKHGADKVVRSLVKAGIAAEAIHGNKSQSQRERVLAAFRDRRRPHAGRHRHRRARHRRRRHQPRHQLRPAERAGELRAPHRPHRARRRRGHRDLVLRPRGARVPARHREADPHGRSRRPISAAQPGQARPAGERTGAPQKKSRQWKPNGERSGQPSRKRNDDQRSRHARPGERMRRPAQPQGRRRRRSAQRTSASRRSSTTIVRNVRQSQSSGTTRLSRPSASAAARRPTNHGAGGIAAVAFMQRGPRPERNSDRRAPR